MARYRRLTLAERYQIAALKNSGLGIRAIGKQLNRPPSTISREISRNGNGAAYDAAVWEDKSQKRLHAALKKQRKIRGQVRQYIREKLKLDWSPEQIVGRRRMLRLETVSVPTIYRYLERDKAEGGRLWTHLRQLRRKHKNRKLAGWKASRTPTDRKRIEQRPEIVETRCRLGDYERDTVLGKRGQSVLLTIVDRTSRLLKLAWVAKSTPKSIHQATVSLLRHEPVNTLTNDNGFEFANHAETSDRLGIDIYFSNAYRSWERGTNENTNGLLRQYFPKKKPIGRLDQNAVDLIANKINRRPRKILGYRTAHEMHKQLKASGVALAA